MKLLPDKGMSVNLTNTHGCTPLYISAQFGHLKATNFFVDLGAALNYTNRLRVAAN
jgi:hypothetical protein